MPTIIVSGDDYGWHNFMNPLIALEERTNLTVTQSAALMGLPRPTYYQYRRTGEMPLYIERLANVLLSLPERTLNNLIAEHVFDGL